MKPLSVLLALLTLGVALSAVAWVTKPTPVTTDHKGVITNDLISEAAEEAVTEETSEAVAENPFELDQTGPTPKAVIDVSMHEFGSMELGQTELYTFVIRNEGEAPLKLHVGPAQCKCTIADLDLNEVSPGESAEIEMSWKPIALEAEFHQKADIWTNDPENSKVELHVKGAVEQLVMISPAGDWPLDRIEEGENGEFSGAIMSRHLDEFNILGFEASSDLITVEFEPLTDRLLDVGKAKCGYQVHVVMKGEMPIGRFRESLILMTDIGGGQDFDVNLSGIRPGPFSIIGENWSGTKMLVRMGDVERSQGKSVKLSIFVSRNEEPVEFEVVSSDPSFLELTFEKDESFDVPAREKHWMTFTVPPDSPIGAWTGQRKGTVLVNTNREAMPQIKFFAELTVDE